MFASGPASLLAVLLIALLLCGPPALCLRFIGRRVRRARYRREPVFWHVLGLIAGLAILGFNGLVLIDVTPGLLQGKAQLGAPEVSALALSWSAFWFWLFLAAAYRLRRRSP